MGNRERASFVLKGKKNGIMVVICGSVHTLFFFSNAAAWGVMFQTLSLVLLSQAHCSRMTGNKILLPMAFFNFPHSYIMGTIKICKKI